MGVSNHEEADSDKKRNENSAKKTQAVLKIAKSLTVDSIPAASYQEYEELFHKIDEDQSGTVEGHELKAQFIKVGLDIDGVRI